MPVTRLFLDTPDLYLATDLVTLPASRKLSSR